MVKKKKKLQIESFCSFPLSQHKAKSVLLKDALLILGMLGIHGLWVERRDMG